MQITAFLTALAATAVVTMTVPPMAGAQDAHYMDSTTPVGVTMVLPDTPFTLAMPKHQDWVSGVGWLQDGGGLAILGEFPVSWTGSDPQSGIASYDVRARKARYDGDFGPWTQQSPWGGRSSYWKEDTTGTSAVYSGRTGYTFCFSVRATNNAGVVSGWSASQCTALPDSRAPSRAVVLRMGRPARWKRSLHGRRTLVPDL